jgi:hypothetical protein
VTVKVDPTIPVGISPSPALDMSGMERVFLDLLDAVEEVAIRGGEAGEAVLLLNIAGGQEMNAEPGTN